MTTSGLKYIPKRAQRGDWHSSLGPSLGSPAPLKSLWTCGRTLPTSKNLQVRVKHRRLRLSLSASSRRSEPRQPRKVWVCTGFFMRHNLATWIPYPVCHGWASAVVHEISRTQLAMKPPCVYARHCEEVAFPTRYFCTGKGSLFKTRA